MKKLSAVLSMIPENSEDKANLLVEELISRIPSDFLKQGFKNCWKNWSESGVKFRGSVFGIEVSEDDSKILIYVKMPSIPGADKISSLSFSTKEGSPKDVATDLLTKISTASDYLDSATKGW